jgi:hypothetical protein
MWRHALALVVLASACTTPVEPATSGEAPAGEAREAILSVALIDVPDVERDAIARESHREILYDRRVTVLCAMGIRVSDLTPASMSVAAGREGVFEDDCRFDFLPQIVDGGRVRLDIGVTRQTRAPEYLSTEVASRENAMLDTHVPAAPGRSVVVAVRPVIVRPGDDVRKLLE